MRKRKQQVTKEEKNLKVSRCSSSGEQQQYFDMIPIDLIIKIFSRLMCGKSMGTCRCVSKLWSSILRGPNRNQLFPINSPEPPRFLFAFEVGAKVLYFSSPQPRNPVENSDLVTTLHHTISYRTDSYVSQIGHPVRGWVCHQRSGHKFTTVMVFNPITRQSFTSPKIMYELVDCDTRSYLGYDPVHNQFKVLSITLVYRSAKLQPAFRHRVLTLETGNLVWRNIPCCIPYCTKTKCGGTTEEYFGGNGICINGVIYYKGTINSEDVIICFNVGSERFDFVAGKKHSTLINYKGKLGAIFDKDNQELVLWVLEDVEEQEWSKHVYEMPVQWPNLSMMYPSYYCAGMTGSGELLYHPIYGVDGCCYIYINLEKKSLVRVRVEVPRFKNFRRPLVYPFPNYVEEVKLM